MILNQDNREKRLNRFPNEQLRVKYKKFMRKRDWRMLENNEHLMETSEIFLFFIITSSITFHFVTTFRNNESQI